MPPPPPWDTPGDTWDSGATWDGAAAKRKAMSNIKAVIDFTGYTALELGPIGQNIHDQMTANAATFTAPPVTMAALATLNTAYETKLAARTSRATIDVIAFNTARAGLEDALALLGNYVNGVAKGDAAKVAESGFPSYSTARATGNSAPAAPQDLRLRQGDVGGDIVARYKPDRPSSTNEVQINLGNPNTEADWHTKGMFKGGRADMDGFTPGALVWVRVRTVGNKGVMGAWSDPAEIRVV